MNINQKGTDTGFMRMVTGKAKGEEWHIQNDNLGGR
jgi:hypothetical protein